MRNHLSALGADSWQMDLHALGLRPPHNAFSQVDVLDIVVELARPVSKSSSAQVTTHQLNHFPG